MEKEYLPANWRKHVSKSHPGKVYYFNVVTKESQWHPPSTNGETEEFKGFKEAEIHVSCSSGSGNLSTPYCSGSTENFSQQKCSAPSNLNIKETLVESRAVTRLGKRKQPTDEGDEDNVQRKKHLSVNDRMNKFKEELQLKKKEKYKNAEINLIQKIKPKDLEPNKQSKPEKTGEGSSTSQGKKPQESNKDQDGNSTKSSNLSSKITKTEDQKKKKISVNDRLCKIRKELALKHNPVAIIKSVISAYQSKGIPSSSRIKKKTTYSVNDRLQKLRDELQTKQPTSENINKITNFSGKNVTETKDKLTSQAFLNTLQFQMNSKAENQKTETQQNIKPSNGGVKRFSVNDRLKNLQTELKILRNNVEKETKDIDMKPDSNINVPEDEDVDMDCPKEAKLPDLEYTPMEWDYIDQEIDRTIEEVRCQLPEEKIQTLADHYDVVEKNLLKLFVENNQSVDIHYEDDKYYCIIDTNVFLKDLYFLNELIELKNDCDTNKIVLIVPYVVLQELDSLKIRTSQAVSTLAVRAIKYLNEKFDQKCLNVRGQSAIDADNHLISIDSADDHIINCCLQLKSKTKFVALLTHDINLKNKARSSDIRCFSKDDFENLKLI